MEVKYSFEIDSYGKREYERFRMHIRKYEHFDWTSFTLRDMGKGNTIYRTIDDKDLNQLPQMIVCSLISNIDFQFVNKQMNFTDNDHGIVGLYSDGMIAYIKYRGHGSGSIIDSVVSIIEKIKVLSADIIYTNDGILEVKGLNKYGKA